MTKKKLSDNEKVAIIRKLVQRAEREINRIVDKAIEEYEAELLDKRSPKA